MKEKLLALRTQVWEHLQPHLAEVKEHGLAGLKMVIRTQMPVLWTKARLAAQAVWQWVTAKVKAVPVTRLALVHVAVGLAAVSLWLVFKTIPEVIALALSMTMVVAFIALIVAFMAYGGVAIFIPLLKPAEDCAD